jgi:sulfite exporter TauE/SafE
VVNLATVLVTGLVAGGASCAAVQGGLLAGLVARQQRNGPPADTPAAATPRQLADDLTPVGGFLAGKLVSHTLLGTALGALGGAVSLSVGVRTATQFSAGALIIVFGLAQLRVPGLRRITLTPPASWSRCVRGRTRSQSALAPTMLGLVSVLIPCGVTLSVEALALTSGSWWAGAATMAVFVIGTAPLFTMLGYVTRKAVTVWRGRLGVLTGVVLLLAGLYTINGALELADSPVSARRVAEAVGLGTDPVTLAEGTRSDRLVWTENGHQTVVVTATANSYRPDNIEIRSGVPTTMIVRSVRVSGCVRAFVIGGREHVLPENGDIHIELGTLSPGRLHYSCGMGMYSGVLTIV